MYTQISRFVWSHLGVCGRCMRTSFRVALIACVVAFALSILFKRYAWVLLVMAIIPTVVWIAHLVVFSIKHTMRRAEAASLEMQESKRWFVLNVVRAMGVMAVGTALPLAAYPACPDNGYASTRTGYGACGQFCRDTQNNKFDCPKDTRPIYLQDGGCTCCPFPECT